MLLQMHQLNRDRQLQWNYGQSVRIADWWQKSFHLELDGTPICILHQQLTILVQFAVHHQNHWHMLWANNALPEAVWHRLRPRSKLSCQSQRQEEAHIGHTLLRTHSPPHTHTHSHADWSAVTTGISGSLTLHRCHLGQKFAPIWQFACGVKECGCQGGGAQGRQAMIKSNTERIRSDVTQAVRAESTPCGMQKPSAAKLSMPQKNFSHNPPAQPPAPPPSAFPQALLSWVDRHTIYPNLFAMCVCVSVGVCVRRTCNQTRWLSGLV